MKTYQKKSDKNFEASMRKLQADQARRQKEHDEGEAIEAELAEQIRAETTRHVLVLAVNATHFDRFRRKVGPVSVKVEYLFKGDQLRGTHPATTMLVLLPKWYLRFETMQPDDARQLRGMLNVFESRMEKPKAVGKIT